MFNTEICFSTFIYIIIFILMIIAVCIRIIFKWNHQDRNYHLKFLAILLSGLVYNIVEGLLPDKNFEINIVSQNIFAWTIGLAVAFHYFTFIKNEYNLTFKGQLSINLIGIFALLSFIILFILPYTITGSLEISRTYFIGFFLALLSLGAILVIHKQYIKIINQKNILFKIYHFNGILAFLGLLSLPATILIFGDNQWIEQTFFSCGFFILIIDYFFYGLRKKEIQQNISFENLTIRETEILNMLLKDPNLKYAELSKALNISEGALSSHLSNIYKKLGIKSKDEIRKISESYKNTLDI